jgi:hypothetical protein
MFNGLSADNLPQLGALRNLQELHWMDVCSAVAGPSTVPDLVFPASLQKLELRESFEAGLSSLLLQRLQDLRVSGAMISRGPVDGHGVVLSNFAHLQHLSSLSLLPANSMHWPPVVCVDVHRVLLMPATFVPHNLSQCVRSFAATPAGVAGDSCCQPVSMDAYLLSRCMQLLLWRAFAEQRAKAEAAFDCGFGTSDGVKGGGSNFYPRVLAHSVVSN